MNLLVQYVIVSMEVKIFAPISTLLNNCLHEILGPIQAVISNSRYPFLKIDIIHYLHYHFYKFESIN
jgi:hypothetical protein